MVGWLSALLKGWPQLAFQFYLPSLPCLLINSFSSWGIFYVPGTVLVLNKPGPLLFSAYRNPDTFQGQRTFPAPPIPSQLLAGHRNLSWLLRVLLQLILHYSLLFPPVILPGSCVLSHEWLYFLLQGWLAPFCSSLGLTAHRRCSACALVSEWSQGPTAAFSNPSRSVLPWGSSKHAAAQRLDAHRSRSLEPSVSVICVASSLTSSRSLLGVSSSKRTCLTTWYETPPLPTGLHSSLSLTAGRILCSLVCLSPFTRTEASWLDGPFFFKPSYIMSIQSRVWIMGGAHICMEFVNRKMCFARQLCQCGGPSWGVSTAQQWASVSPSGAHLQGDWN